tara:strand:+ start:535 stop:1395 length:861 start_codon:yes stop_codon:yes gene_type:complete
MVKSLSQSDEIKKGLYLVPTPIGNLKDITFRAVDILKKSEFILCEDTRISKNLFNKYDIKSKLISNHKFNETKNLSKIIDLLKNGKLISLVSDAGTPGISDPGAVLIKRCIKENIDVFPLPGPSAVTTAISASGFSDKYFFYGFLPEKNKTLIEDLKFLSELKSSIVIFCSSRKINKFIPSMKNYFFDREILICREISKFYEEYIRCDVKELDLSKKVIKGELTIVISEKKNDKKNSHILSESDKRLIKGMINNFGIKEISNLISQNKNISKKEIYNYCLKLKNEK